jgi:hypothetical protein
MCDKTIATRPSPNRRPERVAPSRVVNCTSRYALLATADGSVVADDWGMDGPDEGPEVAPGKPPPGEDPAQAARSSNRATTSVPGASRRCSVPGLGGCGSPLIMTVLLWG